MIDVQGDNEPTSSVTGVSISRGGGWRLAEALQREKEKRALCFCSLYLYGGTGTIFCSAPRTKKHETPIQKPTRVDDGLLYGAFTYLFTHSPHYSNQQNVVICSASRPCFAYVPHAHHLRSSAPHHLKRSLLLHLHLIISQHFEP